MFDIVLFKGTLLKISGLSGNIGVGRFGSNPPDKANDLTVPWRDHNPNPDIFSLLSWQGRASRFVGRDSEVDQLHKWATSDPAVSIKFVTGEGGVGKSRLAAEFADGLASGGWAAGFLKFGRDASFNLKEKGTLLVLDYPEEYQDGVAEFIQDLSGLGNKARIRVLFLTRKGISDWLDTIRINHGSALLDTSPTALNKIGDSQARYMLFSTTQETTAELLGTTPHPVSEGALNSWADLAPENDRPLFLVAAAVKDALEPNDPVVQYESGHVVGLLVERELLRRRRQAQRMGLGEYTLARLLAFASLADDLPFARAKDLCNIAGLRLGIGDLGAMRKAGMLDGEDRVDKPKPNILAAAFVPRVLAQDPASAPELIWTALKGNPLNGLERLVRLSYDTEVAGSQYAGLLSQWLTTAVRGRNLRSKWLEPFLAQRVPQALLPAAVVVYKLIRDTSTDDVERSGALLNLSNHLADSGDVTGSLEAARGSVEICRRLARRNSSQFESDLADSLTALCACLGEVGDHAGALAAAHECAEIYRRLARLDSRRKPDLAVSLNNLSNRLANEAEYGGALAAAEEAVKLFRGVSRANPGRFERDLSVSLLNLANCLSASGDDHGAVRTCGESIAICRRLTRITPAFFEQDLATSLNHQSVYLSHSGDKEGAFRAGEEAVTIFRRLADVNPARFTPELAVSLNSLASRLLETGEGERALEVSSESLQLSRRLAVSNPARFQTELARSLATRGRVLAILNWPNDAAESYREGIEILRPLAENRPKSPTGLLHAQMEVDLQKLDKTRLAKEKDDS